jgi:putative effector of murein hydrolase
MGIAEQIGGVPSLAAILCRANGYNGAAFGRWLLTKCRVGAALERGLAMGVTSISLAWMGWPQPGLLRRMSPEM